ncbi:MAG: hypothetical protein H0V27_00785 [Pyrinomonadaceae bacterium]|jgi:hypothetical protein|nr:hypothetical protein [Pyrinomonadaceae bacterium]
MTLAIIAIVLVVSAALIFTLARRALRLVVRLALVGALLFAVLAGALFYWYKTGGLNSYLNTRTPATNRSTRNTNR